MKKWTFLFLALLPLFCVLPGCQKNEALESPESYRLGEDSAPALTLGDGTPKLAACSTPEEGPLTYTYEELVEAGTAAGDYAARLTDGEEFTPVDEDGAEADLPDFTQAEGSVRLARPSVEEGELFELTLEWSEGGCVVTAERRAGTITPKPVEGMTLQEAGEYLKQYLSAAVGAPGGDTEEYAVYPESGTVLVNGEACVELSVYKQGEPSGSNQIVGVYFLTGDRAHLYRLDLASRAVEEVPRRRQVRADWRPRALFHQ